MSECVFCKIIAGEIPAVKIWENEEFIAFLDVFPACTWQTLVVPKTHCNSDVFVLDDNLYTSLMLSVKYVVSLLKKWLEIDRVGMVVEWLQVPHAHVKLYPFWEWKSFVWWFSSDTMVDIAALQQVADKIL